MAVRLNRQVMDKTKTVTVMEMCRYIHVGLIGRWEVYSFLMAIVFISDVCYCIGNFGNTSVFLIPLLSFKKPFLILFSNLKKSSYSVFHFS